MLLTLNRAKNQTDRYLLVLSSGKKWENLKTRGSISRGLERDESVVRFHLTTGHDYSQAHMHRIGLYPNETCPLCDNTDDSITGTRLMVERPRTGVGYKKKCINKNENMR